MAPGRRTRFVLCGTVIAALAACGSDDSSSSDDASSGGSSGASSGGGSATGGSAGGGNGTGGSDGTGGSGGTPSVTDVLNPSLPTPTHDCRNDPMPKQCVSLSGVFDGEAVDLHCTIEMLPRALLASPDRWPVACADDPQGMVGYRYQVEVPIQAPGTFEYTLAPGTERGPNVVVERDNEGGDTRADNFEDGALAGRIDEDPTTGNEIISGTFRATWSAPEATCRAVGSDACRQMDVHGTFRVEHYLTPEDF